MSSRTTFASRASVGIPSHALTQATTRRNSTRRSGVSRLTIASTSWTYVPTALIDFTKKSRHTNREPRSDEFFHRLRVLTNLPLSIRCKSLVQKMADRLERSRPTPSRIHGVSRKKQSILLSANAAFNHGLIGTRCLGTKYLEKRRECF